MKNKKKHEGLSARTTDKKEVALPVKKPKGKSVVPVEIFPWETRTDDMGLSKLEESFDLDRIEKELRELDTQGSFLDQFFSTSDERTKKKLEIKTEIQGLRHALRQNIINVEKQRITARTELLELKAGLLEKEVMSEEKFQKPLLEIKLTKLNIEKLRIEIEEQGLIQTKKDLEKEAKEEEESSEEKYGLKDLGTLMGSPDDKEDDEEDGE